MNMKSTLGIIAATALAYSTAALPQDFSNVENTYEVTITNLTSGQSFTPVLLATHSRFVSLFETGAAPSQAIADMAEGGDTSGLMTVLMESGEAWDIQTTGDGLIGPGESVTVQIKSGGNRHTRLSLAGMLLPTNDTFVAVRSFKLPRWSETIYAQAYDAGSEDNDELCASIPGPTCGGEPFSDGLGEGFVHISRGISGEGGTPMSRIRGTDSPPDPTLCGMLSPKE
jgi:hypothetical protein